MNENNHAPRCILLVDDSSFLRKRVRQALMEAGYAVVEADSGVSALEAIEKQRFDCIMTDLVMPSLDGFGLVTEIKRRQIQTPIVVLTADIQKTTHDRCQALGVTAFMQKPVKSDALRGVLAGIFGQ